MLGDLKSKKVIMFKGFLFLLIGLLGFAASMLLYPDWRLALLMICTIWGFCRFYYFAFYVIEKYVDPEYKFAGLTDFMRYILSRKK